MVVTPTTSIVYQLAMHIPKAPWPQAIFMDNLFSSTPLYSKLWEHGIEACGTVRAHLAGLNFPPILHVLKDFAKVCIE